MIRARACLVIQGRLENDAVVKCRITNEKSARGRVMDHLGIGNRYGVYQDLAASPRGRWQIETKRLVFII
jgi:hypothetical protein